jgi:ketosteroid isomerase-like protein
MKNIVLKITMILLIGILAGTQLYAQKEADKLKNEIKALNDKLIKAGLSDDMESMAALYSDNVIQMPNFEPMVKGKEMMMEHAKKQKEAGFKMLSMALNIDEVFPDKLYVIETGTYQLSMSMPGMEKPMDDKGKYITVWERQKDGSLKIFIETWNTDMNPMEMEKK